MRPLAFVEMTGWAVRLRFVEMIACVFSFIDKENVIFLLFLLIVYYTKSRNYYVI